VQDPALYLRKRHIALRCAVDSTRRAVIDSLHVERVGIDLYFVSSRGAGGRFAAEPLRYASTLTDPVTFRRFHPGAASPRSTFAGRPYFFEDAAAKRRFDAHPDSFAVVHGGVIPEGS
jgi:YHS domain-containing protein